MALLPPPAIQEKAEAPPTGFARVAGALGLLSVVADVDVDVGVGGAPPLLEDSALGVAALTLRLTVSQRTVGAGAGEEMPFWSNAEEAAPWLLRRLNSPLDRDGAGGSKLVPLRAAEEDIETDF